MKCWICDKEIKMKCWEGELLALTNHFYTHGKSELIGCMVWEHYNKKENKK